MPESSLTPKSVAPVIDDHSSSNDMFGEAFSAAWGLDNGVTRRNSTVDADVVVSGALWPKACRDVSHRLLKSFASFQSAFDSFDTDHDGKLNSLDLKRAFKPLGIILETRQIAALFKEVLEVPTESLIDYPQFLKLLASSRTDVVDEVGAMFLCEHGSLQKAFRTLDTNHDAALTITDVREALNNLNLGLAAAQKDSVIVEVFGKEGNFIDFPRFTAVFNKRDSETFQKEIVTHLIRVKYGSLFAAFDSFAEGLPETSAESVVAGLQALGLKAHRDYHAVVKPMAPSGRAITFHAFEQALAIDKSPLLQAQVGDYLRHKRGSLHKAFQALGPSNGSDAVSTLVFKRRLPKLCPHLSEEQIAHLANLVDRRKQNIVRESDFCMLFEDQDSRIMRLESNISQMLYRRHLTLDAAFNSFNPSNSGLISLLDMSKGFKKLGVGMTETELFLFVRSTDSDGNGYIDRAEFKAMFAKDKHKRLHEDIVNCLQLTYGSASSAFSAFAGGKSKVGPVEFVQGVMELGTSLTLADMPPLMRRLESPASTGFLSETEFTKFFEGNWNFGPYARTEPVIDEPPPVDEDAVNTNVLVTLLNKFGSVKVTFDRLGGLDEVLYKEGFLEVTKTLDLELSDNQTFESVWARLDLKSRGSVTYQDFLRAFQHAVLITNQSIRARDLSLRTVLANQVVAGIIDKYATLLDAFRAWDSSEAGMISKRHFRQGIHGLGLKMSESEVGAVVNFADENHDGQIDYRELLAAFGTQFRKLQAEKNGDIPLRQPDLAPVVVPPSLRRIVSAVWAKFKTPLEAFLALDVDQAGRLRVSDLRKGVEKILKFSLDQKEAESVIVVVDVNGDAVIDFQEFRPICKRPPATRLRGGLKRGASNSSVISLGADDFVDDDDGSVVATPQPTYQVEGGSLPPGTLTGEEEDGLDGNETVGTDEILFSRLAKHRRLRVFMTLKHKARELLSAKFGTMEKAFNMLGVPGTNCIPKASLVNGLGDLWLGISAEQLESLAHAVDLDGDGLISQEEFLSAFAKPGKRGLRRDSLAVGTEAADDTLEYKSLQSMPEAVAVLLYRHLDSLLHAFRCCDCDNTGEVTAYWFRIVISELPGLYEVDDITRWLQSYSPPGGCTSICYHRFMEAIQKRATTVNEPRHVVRRASSSLTDKKLEQKGGRDVKYRLPEDRLKYSFVREALLTKFGTLRHAFEAFDKDHTGILRAEGLYNALLQSDIDCTLRQARAFVEEASSHATKTAVSCPDFVAGLMVDDAKTPAPSAASPKNVFSPSQIVAKLRPKVATAIHNRFATLKEAFSEFDTNHDECLTLEEFGRGIDSLNIGAVATDIGHLMNDMDKSENGLLEYEEFASALPRRVVRREQHVLPIQRRMSMFDISSVLQAAQAAAAMGKIEEGGENDVLAPLPQLQLSPGPGRSRSRRLSLPAIGSPGTLKRHGTVSDLKSTALEVATRWASGRKLVAQTSASDLHSDKKKPSGTRRGSDASAASAASAATADTAMSATSGAPQKRPPLLHTDSWSSMVGGVDSLNVVGGDSPEPKTDAAAAALDALAEVLTPEAVTLDSPNHLDFPEPRSAQSPASSTATASPSHKGSSTDPARSGTGSQPASRTPTHKRRPFIAVANCATPAQKPPSASPTPSGSATPLPAFGDLIPLEGALDTDVVATPPHGYDELGPAPGDGPPAATVSATQEKRLPSPPGGDRASDLGSRGSQFVVAMEFELSPIGDEEEGKAPVTLPVSSPRLVEVKADPDPPTALSPTARQVHRRLSVSMSPTPPPEENTSPVLDAFGSPAPPSAAASSAANSARNSPRAPHALSPFGEPTPAMPSPQPSPKAFPSPSHSAIFSQAGSVSLDTSPLPPIRGLPQFDPPPTVFPSDGPLSPSPLNSAAALRVPESAPPQGFEARTPPSMSPAPSPRTIARDLSEAQAHFAREDWGAPGDWELSLVSRILWEELLVQYQSAGAAFRALDRDKDGVLSLPEFTKGVTHLKCDISSAQIQKLHKEMGPNFEYRDFVACFHRHVESADGGSPEAPSPENKKLTLSISSRASSAVSSVARPAANVVVDSDDSDFDVPQHKIFPYASAVALKRAAPRLRRLLHVVDPHRTGVLPVPDFHSVLQAAMLGLRDEQLVQIARAADAEGTGCVQIEDFLQAISQCAASPESPPPQPEAPRSPPEKVPALPNFPQFRTRRAPRCSGPIPLGYSRFPPAVAIQSWPPPHQHPSRWPGPRSRGGKPRPKFARIPAMADPVSSDSDSGVAQHKDAGGSGRQNGRKGRGEPVKGRGVVYKMSGEASGRWKQPKAGKAVRNKDETEFSTIG